ncbi:potassium channel subfamily K member 4-like isoform X2 [Octopus sinensis]|uniref:Potassium channel subfamily K member 4-like isoform X2 n=1 Tax=Octopus sinensis TaxID=2607531 RepID=A0A7E6F3Z6_9MOLL|nr:potassium channel subfamily K member 4-like isoform X2 [Octopus sinensis]XP_036361667.1 potassium channel subfamily K member 4-like isoform X2 [Octopus sinensis]XP_036361670.1 potassium channel subfamily K member 4-like isoform X2 [Octopus sinensis]
MGCCCKKEPASKEEQKIPKRGFGQKCRSCGLKFVAFLFSHIGLTCLVAGYSILGGYVFMKIEKPFEVTQRSNVGKIRRLAVSRLWNYTENLNILKEEHWKQKVDEKLKYFQLEIFKAVKNEGWDGTDEVSPDYEGQWSFSGALLYSVTVITTIGYGHIAPKTVWGRLATIAYAVFGIPLTLLCLANLGNLLASCFRVFYYQVLCCQWCKKTKTKNRTPAIRSEMAPTYVQSGNLNMENSESVNSTFIDGSNVTPRDTVVYSIDESPENETRNIPVVVTLLIMTGYILCGTLLFTMWEKDWNYVEGSYFCFITLSTIGFGDFVPGSSLDSWHNQSKQIICSVYLLFGLALVAMCFELMQNQVRETFTRLGRKLGIIKSNR